MKCLLKWRRKLTFPFLRFNLFRIAENEKQVRKIENVPISIRLYNKDRVRKAKRTDTDSSNNAETFKGEDHGKT